MAARASAVVTVAVELDVTALADHAVAAARAAAGEAPLPPAQHVIHVRAALEHLLADARAQTPSLVERTRAALPDGVELELLEQTHRGPVATSTARFKLVDVVLLPQLALASSAGEDVVARPLESFKVTRTPDAITVVGELPVTPAPQQANARTVLTLESGVAVKKHNAPNVDGNRLTWETTAGSGPVMVQVTLQRR